MYGVNPQPSLLIDFDVNAANGNSDSGHISKTVRLKIC